MTGLNAFNFNNTNQNNPLMDILRQYIPQQQAPIAEQIHEPMRSTNGFNVYEITAKSDIEYIEQDKSGRMQVYVCPNEKRIYTSRYNHVKKEPDYKAYIEEEEVKLFQKPDTSAEMSQIAEALVAVVNQLTSMRNEIQEIKNAEPKEIIKEIPVEVIKEVIKEVPVEITGKAVRDANGRFIKKGGKQ